MLDTIKVSYEWTDKPHVAIKWLRELPQLVALDFETASKYTPEEQEQFTEASIDELIPIEDRRLYHNMALSDALSHPAHTVLTHLVIGISDSKSKVIVLPNDKIRKVILDWIITTEVQQVWHNASYDFKHIFYHTGKFPKNYEDSQVLAKTILNHVDNMQSKTGLKDLAGPHYGDWGITADYFDATQMYNEKVIEYAAIDGCATMWLWNSMGSYLRSTDNVHPTVSTNSNHCVWDLLPAPIPRFQVLPENYFYENVAKHLIPTTVELMLTGLPIDLDRVADLESTLDETLAAVNNTLAGNPIIKDYLIKSHSSIVDSYIKDQKSKIKDYTHFLKPFDHKKMEHRSYFMHLYALDHDLSPPEETFPTGISKWPARTVKALKKTVLNRLLEGNISENNKYLKASMKLLAEHKAELYNKRFGYHENIANAPDLPLPEFNPGSSDQKQDVLTGILGYESDKTTDAYKDYERLLRNQQRYGGATPDPPKNKFSWGRKQLEHMLSYLEDPDEIELVQALIDHSMSAIIKNNFIKSFYEYTLYGRLHGQYKLLGAKSGRYTSSAPNMLNSPSTGSVYAKPIKKCFTAPPGYLTFTIDYSSLEDRVLACLTHDPGKLAIYGKKKEGDKIVDAGQGVDGHCYSALGYFPEQIYKHIPNTGDMVTDAIAFKDAVDSGNKELKDLRQDSKPITFKLAYLGMPDADKGGVITQDIYDGYHQKVYPNIMKQVNEYIIPQTKNFGKIHLGLGFNIKTDRPGKDVRTLNNALNQFWSILTATSIHELNRRRHADLVDPSVVQCTSTIYDSIYGIVKDDPELIKWLNDNIVEIMIKDFVEDQAVPNEAALEIGTDWSDMIELDNDTTIDEISEVIQQLKEQQ